MYFKMHCFDPLVDKLMPSASYYESQCESMWPRAGDHGPVPGWSGCLALEPKEVVIAAPGPTHSACTLRLYHLVLAWNGDEPCRSLWPQSAHHGEASVQRQLQLEDPS